jgi:hypothetical protein
MMVHGNLATMVSVKNSQQHPVLSMQRKQVASLDPCTQGWHARKAGCTHCNEMIHC